MGVFQNKRIANPGPGALVVNLLDPNDANNAEWLGPWDRVEDAIVAGSQIAITAVNTGSALAWIGTTADVAPYEADPLNGPLWTLPPGGTINPLMGGVSSDYFPIERRGDLVLYLEAGADVVLFPSKKL